MKLVQDLANRWKGNTAPFLIYKGNALRFSDLAELNEIDLSEVRAGDVVVLVGDIDPLTIWTLLRLIDKGAIVVPLTKDTANDHEYFFETAHVDVIIQDNHVTRRLGVEQHELIQQLRKKGHAGLILFSTGTTSRPKAILHDLTLFLERYAMRRPTLRTINFLLFDHIGGINTLLHTLFNQGVVIAPEVRTVTSVLEACREYEVELLPTTPTFLRMMLLSGAVPDHVPKSLKIITYGTERMDQPTLTELCKLLPKVDFRQTFGMSELGIVRVKSKARNSLFMKIGGEGIETKTIDNVLYIRSSSRMLGYLNAQSPFDEDGWYNTRDMIEQEDGYFRVTGRDNEVINVGGMKFMAGDVERVALEFPNVELVKAYGCPNPITGQHIELSAQPLTGSVIDASKFKDFLKSRLQPYMMPKRIRIEAIAVAHSFKRA